MEQSNGGDSKEEWLFFIVLLVVASLATIWVNWLVQNFGTMG